MHNFEFYESCQALRVVYTDCAHVAIACDRDLKSIKIPCCQDSGEGKVTYTFSANANVLSDNFLFSMLPAGREGVGTF
jgi:hypothetical protein